MGLTGRYERPECHGNEHYYNPSDADCQRCNYQHSCEVEIQGDHVNWRRPARHVQVRQEPVRAAPAGEAVSVTQSGIVRTGETAGQRFVKDVLTGACRGMFWEAYQFFRAFRF